MGPDGNISSCGERLIVSLEKAMGYVRTGLHMIDYGKKLRTCNSMESRELTVVSGCGKEICAAEYRQIRVFKVISRVLVEVHRKRASQEKEERKTEDEETVVRGATVERRSAKIQNRYCLRIKEKKNYSEAGKHAKKRRKLS